MAKLKNGEVVEKYLWLNLTTLLAVYDKDDNLLQRFEYADGRMPLSFTDSDGDSYYIAYNQIGSPRAVTNEDGDILKTLTYDSFGNILHDSNPGMRIPFGFAGGLYDEDTKLTRFGFRDYDASTGKWTAKDPIGFDGGDSNLYGYVLGDPVGFVDPTGEAPVVVVIIVYGALVYLVYDNVSDFWGFLMKQKQKIDNPKPIGTREYQQQWCEGIVDTREYGKEANNDVLSATLPLSAPVKAVTGITYEAAK